MTEKTARQIANMKKQTVGVEVEMNDITRKSAVRVAAEYFWTHQYEFTGGRNGYVTWSAWDADRREWKFQQDVSIHGDADQQCELVTPILNYDDIETLQGLLRALRKSVLQNSQPRLPAQAQRSEASDNEPACKGTKKRKTKTLADRNGDLPQGGLRRGLH